MSTWLSDYEILLWKNENGNIFVSHNSPVIAINLANQGYVLLGDYSKLQGWASKVLDECDGAMNVANMKEED